MFEVLLSLNLLQLHKTKNQFFMKKTMRIPNLSWLIMVAVMIFLNTGCSKEEQEKQPITDTVEDIDGNVYKTILIGDQWWMAENLRVTTMNDGRDIVGGLNNADWEAATEPAWAVYPHLQLEGLDSDQEVLESYGALYNWEAARSVHICPVGWRLPDSQDWDILFEYTGGSTLAGKNLRSARITPEVHPRWDIAEQPIDEFGFSALPAGQRDIHGDFAEAGEMGLWWKKDGVPTYDSHYIYISVTKDHVSTISETTTTAGLSIRCLKNI